MAEVEHSIRPSNKRKLPAMQQMQVLEKPKEILTY